MNVPYPKTARERDHWIRQQRGSRSVLPSDSRLPAAFFVERELSASGEIVDIATLFLLNRECPWTCVMCDLWRHTLPETIASGLVPAQIAHALRALPPARQIKLYNAGSFFDAGAIPPADYPAIAEQVNGFERVIVECHPALITERILPFRDRLAGTLEIAVGLETAHPAALEKINKRMSVEQFQAAADFLRSHGIALRVFLLAPPPFVPEEESDFWLARSIDVAFAAGATVVAMIPLRSEDGAIAALQAAGEVAAINLSRLETAQEYAISQGRGRGRGFADTWDLEKLSECPQCFPARAERLRKMNHSQQILPRIACAACASITQEVAKTVPTAD